MLRNPQTPGARTLSIVVGIVGGLGVVVAIAVLFGQDIGDSIAAGLAGAFAVGLVYAARGYTRKHRAHHTP
jgi:tetrahydromethanopterin S-methyltransferase subunit D